MAAWDNMIDRFKEVGLLERFAGQSEALSDLKVCEWARGSVRERE